MIGLCLDHTAPLEAAIATLDGEGDRVMAPFERARDHLDTIPGVGKRAAECIIAEIGVDMSWFPPRPPGLLGGDGAREQHHRREAPLGPDHQGRRLVG
jgi:transposase